MSDDAWRDQPAPTAIPRRRSRYEGIVLRHARGCRSRAGDGCSCSPTFQAQVWSPREQKTIRKTFAVLSQARAWRQESQIALRKGTLRSPSHTTLQQAADEWLAAAEGGVARTRSGDGFKPSAIRAYRQALNRRDPVTTGCRMNHPRGNQLAKRRINRPLWLDPTVGVPGE